eukprot:232764_1
MSSRTFSDKYPPTPQHYICAACNIGGKHWIMQCDNLEEYLEQKSQYIVNYDHINIKVNDFADSIDIDEKNNDEKYNANKLISIFDKLSITTEELSLWAGYSDEKLFYSKEDAKNKLISVIEFAESNSSCSLHIKKKLRMITKLIIEKNNNDIIVDYTHILLLIASHGEVCNVMKEVAIANAYGLMTDKLTDFIHSQTIQQQIIKVLRDLRILLVEKLYHYFKMENNTHYIAGFHNVLAKHIGVNTYNDPDIWTPSSQYCKDWKKGLKERYFKLFYNKNTIIDHIQMQINEQKIKYQRVVSFFQDNCPKDKNSMEFLQQAIDIDTGKINKEYICWLLEKLNILMKKTNNWKPIQKCWDDGIEEKQNTILTASEEEIYF